MLRLLTKTIQSITGNMIQPERNDLGGSEQTLVDLGTQPLVNNLCKTRKEALSAIWA